MTLSDSGEDEDLVDASASDEEPVPNKKKLLNVDKFSWEEGNQLEKPSVVAAAQPSERVTALTKKISQRLQEKMSALQEEEEAEEAERAEEEDDEDEDEEEEDDEEDEAGEEDDGQENAEEDDSSEDEEEQELKPLKKQKAEKEPKPSKQIQVASTSSKLTKTLTFDMLNLSRPLSRAIRELNWVDPTPVQQMAIPSALAGRDLLVNAVTGSGKTGAFVLPILERLLYRPKRVPLTRVLIITPTRELAAQIHDTASSLAKYTDIRSCLIVGGLSQQAQETALKSRPDILVVTPGRMIDHLQNTSSIHLEDLEILVLDEADRLLELGFTDQVKELVKACPRGRQTMLFSATLTESVADLVNLSLNQPERISADPFCAIVKELSHEFIRVKNKNREAIVLALCQRTFKDKVIIFMPSKQECHRLAIIFGLAKLQAAELHGNLTQAQRLEALQQFSKGAVNVLLATDVASRGLDIRGVKTVINFSLPRALSSYIHRVGRTARAGQSGCAVTLAGEDQRKELKEVLKNIKGAKGRKIDPKVVERYTRLLESFEEDIKEVLEQERIEKADRVANMEAAKAQNLMKFEDEIYNRPARSWFQTSKEKLASQLSAERTFDKKEPAITKSSKKKDAEKAPKKKDPLAGLTRKKRRRKQMMMEAEEMAKQNRIKAEQGDAEAIQALKTEKAVANAGRIAKSARKRTKEQLDKYLPHAREQDNPSKKKRKIDPNAKKPTSHLRYATINAPKDRFMTSKEPPLIKENKTEKKGPGHHAFKSKKKFKRR